MYYFWKEAVTPWKQVMPFCKTELNPLYTTILLYKVW